MSAAENAFDAACKTYYEGVIGVLNTAYALLIERAREQWPTATRLVLLGSYNEASALRLVVDEVHLGQDRLSVDDGNDDVQEFSDANEPVLGYLGDLGGDDYLHRTEIDL